MIYVVINYPEGWIKAERVIEDECIEKYLNGEISYNIPIYILGFNSFLDYMYCLNSHNVLHVTKHGYIYRLWNNMQWIVVEASSNFEAINEARMILNDDCESNQ